MAVTPESLEETKVGKVEDVEALVAKAQTRMDRMLDIQENPKPKLLHALDTMLEAQETRFAVSHYLISRNRGFH